VCSSDLHHYFFDWCKMKHMQSEEGTIYNSISATLMQNYIFACGKACSKWHTGNDLFNIEFKTCPLGEWFRVETDSWSLWLDHVINDSGAGEPLVRLNCARRLGHTPGQPIDSLPGVGRELPSVNQRVTALHPVTIFGTVNSACHPINGLSRAT